MNQMIRNWLREHRGFLIALPVALIIGFGWPGYQWWTGNDGVAHRARDVGKDEVAHYNAGEFQLTGLSVEQPKPKQKFSIGPDIPKNAVVVVARFRGRIDNARSLKKFYCAFTVENSDGWTWDSASGLGQEYIPEGTSQSCNGETLNKGPKPQPNQWYKFTVGFIVPENRTHGLRPTLDYYKSDPYYLRFAH